MEFEDFIKRIVTSLNRSNLKYVIVGGFAAIFRGKPRTTMDLDLIVEDNHQKLHKFLNELKKVDFDVFDEQIQIAIKERTHISIFDKKSILRIDLKIAKNLDEFEVLSQGKSESYKGMKLLIAPVEQILYGKILYIGNISHIPDSELLEINDVLDFINVYRRSKNINLDWLRSKIKEKGLIKTLQNILKLSENL